MLFYFTYTDDLHPISKRIFLQICTFYNFDEDSVVVVFVAFPVLCIPAACCVGCVGEYLDFGHRKKIVYI